MPTQSERKKAPFADPMNSHSEGKAAALAQWDSSTRRECSVEPLNTGFRLTDKATATRFSQFLLASSFSPARLSLRHQASVAQCHSTLPFSEFKFRLGRQPGSCDERASFWRLLSEL